MNSGKSGHSVHVLPFRPIRGFASPHLQTIVPTVFLSGGKPPPSAPFYIHLQDGDILHGMLSSPPDHAPARKTIILIHGLGGSHASSYMVRLSRKFHAKGFRVLRLNLRGSGPGASTADKPYHGGTSLDLLQVVQTMKRQFPNSPLIIAGFSLGGNIALKLAGELGDEGAGLIEKTISICAPIDLAHTIRSLDQGVNQFYHQYYVKGLKKLGRPWLGGLPIRSIIDFDQAVTAPRWGFRDAHDYYRQGSSCYHLSKIKHPCHLIFAEDDPFVDHTAALSHSASSHAKIWLSPYGGHMGFLGWAGWEHRFQWLDHFLIQLIENRIS